MFSKLFFCVLVTPLAGVWVEIIYANHLLPTVVVTPLAGVWVEIGSTGTS